MLFFKQLNTLPGPLFKIYSCWSVGVPGGLCMPHGEGVAIRESQFSQWVPRTELSSAGLEERTFILWGILLSPTLCPCFFSPWPIFFFLCLFSGPPLVFSSFLHWETRVPNHIRLGCGGLGLTLRTWAMDHLCGSLGKIALRVILIWVFNLSSRYFFRSTWAFTYVSFSLDDC